MKENKLKTLVVYLIGGTAVAFALLLSMNIPRLFEKKPVQTTVYPEVSTVVSEPGEPQTIVNPDGSVTMFGTASWYDYKFDEEGWGTPCFRDREECYTTTHRVAAMRDIPRGKPVTVTNLTNGKSVDVLITDFGPDESEFPGRIIDLSSFAFSQIADLNAGIIEVRVEWGN